MAQIFSANSDKSLQNILHIEPHVFLQISQFEHEISQPGCKGQVKKGVGFGTWIPSDSLLSLYRNIGGLKWHNHFSY